MMGCPAPGTAVKLKAPTFLAFVNTADDADKSRTLDGVPDVGMMVAWARTIGLAKATEPQAALLGRTALEHLQRLREAGWGLLKNLIAKQAADGDHESVVREAVSTAKYRGKLELSDGRYAWRANESGYVLLDRIAFAADALLTAEDLASLKECERCTALFLDNGRGPGRRYCRPETCGNRAKVARFRENKRSSGTASRSPA
ncbi:MAG: CGNR zinc finger domain-containing protein [Galactobacter sp.]|uniref:CGNR zinc finger domain-containing protein n=1 Tax=Galactobacter sp. TaxID=2676125 RepID=UPI0025BDE48C|nr:CGNR zinc finger domain-containing protein [Galactobacter sp.]